MADLKSLTIDDTGSLSLPTGDSGDRPTITTTVDQFTTVGTTSWTAPSGVTKVEVLVVAGGAGGASRHGGGGGAGGLIHELSYPVTPGQSYTVTVGAGGSGAAAGSGTQGSNGGNSVFDSLTAIGGGYGSSAYLGTSSTGGSTGGTRGAGGTPPAGPSVPGQGHPGGTGDNTGSYSNGGGGGGAGGPGFPGAASEPRSGQGGPGLLIDISGTPTWYASGGGAGGSSEGATGGPNGGNGYNGGTGGTAGAANTGSGGGAGGHTSSTNHPGGAGGSGVVIIKYSVDSDSQQPVAQTRFNEQTGTLEVFSNSNRFKARPANNKIVQNGLIVSLDPTKYIAGSTVWYDDVSNLEFDVTGTTENVNGNKNQIRGASGGTVYFRGPDYAPARFGNEAFTLECWIYLANLDYGSWRYIFGKSTFWNAASYGIYIDGGGDRVGFHTSSTNGLEYPIDDMGIGWHHIAAVRHGEGRALYIDGVLVAEDSTVNTVTATQTISYGADNEGTYTDATYRFGPARIYSKALTSDEVEQNFNAECDRFELGAPLPPITDPSAVFVQDDLVLNLDASNPASYYASVDSSYWRDTASGYIGTDGGGQQSYVEERGGGIFFDGSGNDYFDLNTNNILSGYQEWTFDAYYRVIRTDVTGEIFGNYGSGYTADAIWIAGRYGAYLNGSVYVPGSPLGAGVYHMAITRRSGGQITTYLNGVRRNYGTLNANIRSDINYRIATDVNGAGEPFGGIIYSMRAYHRVLTDAEVLQNYHACLLKHRK